MQLGIQTRIFFESTKQFWETLSAMLHKCSFKNLKALPAKPAEETWTIPLFGTKMPLKVSFDFE